MLGQGASAEQERYGFVPLRLNAEETARFIARRVKPATVNDMLIAAMLLCIRRWNRGRGGGKNRVSTMMPINIRPQEWWFEVVGNYSSYVTINLLRQCPDDFDAAVRMVSEQTQALKQTGAAGTLIDLLDIPKFLPAALKAQLKYITPTLGRNLVDSTWVSNLGRLASPPTMGEAGAVSAFYFSPPSPSPMAITLGVACMADQLYLGLRYRSSLLSQAEAQQFATELKGLLLSE